MACYQDIISSLPFRVFSIQIGRKIDYWLHTTKTADKFQIDIQTFSAECKNISPKSIQKGLAVFLEKEDYIPVSGLVSDGFAGKILPTSARLVRN